MPVGQLRFGCVFLKLRSSRGNGGHGEATLLACFLYSWQTRSKQLMRFASDQRRRRNSRNQYSLTRSCKNRFWASQQRSDLSVCFFVCFFFFFGSVLFCFVAAWRRPARWQYLCFFFLALFSPHPPNCLGLDGLQQCIYICMYVFKLLLLPRWRPISSKLFGKLLNWYT